MLKIKAFVISLVTVVTAALGLFVVSSLLAKAGDHRTIRVAVIDTGLDLTDNRFKHVLCADGHTDFTGTGIKDRLGHGTHVAGLIKKYAGYTDYCLVILKFYDKSSVYSSTEYLSRALREALSQKVDIINISAGGRDFNEDEYNSVKSHPNTIIIGAAGNEGSEIRWYPGCLDLPNTRCVGALNRKGTKLNSSNYGKWVKYWHIGENVWSTLPGGREGPLTGTSMATAIETGLAIKFNRF